jgi:sRNA-binding carbon storage regulator CsrA
MGLTLDLQRNLPVARNMIWKRKKGQSITIGPPENPVIVTVCKTGETVKLHVQADQGVRIVRTEQATSHVVDEENGKR